MCNVQSKDSEEAKGLHLVNISPSSSHLQMTYVLNLDLWTALELLLGGQGGWQVYKPMAGHTKIQSLHSVNGLI